MHYTKKQNESEINLTDTSNLWTAAESSSQGEYRVDCPQCSKRDGDKTLSLNHSKGVGHCFRCGWNPRRFGATLYDNSSGSHNEEPTPQKQSRFNSIRDQQSQFTADDPVALFLRDRLGSLPDRPPNLGYAPALSRYVEGIGVVATPAMVGALVDVTGRTTGWHTTAITWAGKKAYGKDSRRYAGLYPLGGSAVHLYPAGETLIVAEGIETALALHIASSEAVWACTSAPLLASFEPPPEVNQLLIAADNDQNRTGQESANRLYQRLKSKVSCAILTPENEGRDWLDELIRE